MIKSKRLMFPAKISFLSKQLRKLVNHCIYLTNKFQNRNSLYESETFKLLLVLLLDLIFLL